MRIQIFRLKFVQKMDLGLEFQKANLRIRISILKKQTALTFSAQICPKVDLGLAIQKTIVGIRISILDIPCVPIFSQNEQL